jgi:hypothetical protein
MCVSSINIAVHKTELHASNAMHKGSNANTINQLTQYELLAATNSAGHPHYPT